MLKYAALLLVAASAVQEEKKGDSCDAYGPRTYFLGTEFDQANVKECPAYCSSGEIRSIEFNSDYSLSNAECVCISSTGCDGTDVCYISGLVSASKCVPISENDECDRRLAQLRLLKTERDTITTETCPTTQICRVNTEKSTCPDSILFKNDCGTYGLPIDVFNHAQSVFTCQCDPDNGNSCPDGQICTRTPMELLEGKGVFLFGGSAPTRGPYKCIGGCAELSCSGTTPVCLQNSDGQLKCGCTADSCGSGTYCYKHPFEIRSDSNTCLSDPWIGCDEKDQTTNFQLLHDHKRICLTSLSGCGVSGQPCVKPLICKIGGLARYCKCETNSDCIEANEIDQNGDLKNDCFQSFTDKTCVPDECTSCPVQCDSKPFFPGGGFGAWAATLNDNSECCQTKDGKKCVKYTEVACGVGGPCELPLYCMQGVTFDSCHPLNAIDTVTNQPTAPTTSPPIGSPTTSSPTPPPPPTFFETGGGFVVIGLVAVVGLIAILRAAYYGTLFFGTNTETVAEWIRKVSLVFESPFRAVVLGFASLAYDPTSELAKQIMFSGAPHIESPVLGKSYGEGGEIQIVKNVL